MTAEAKIPTLEQLLQAVPTVARAMTSSAPLVLRSGGAAVTPELRDQLLAKCATGEYVELDVDLLAYEQQAGVANRNFVRFRDGAMLALGRSGIGKPFLRDHAQGNSLARAGTIIESNGTKRGEGDYAINMTARLTAPWAVDMALRNLLSGVSIGWAPTGSVECSIHGSPVMTKCGCWPGDRMSELVDGAGNKKYTRDRSGSLVAEWIYTSADLVECSVCNVPAVPSAGIDGVRASLSAAGFDVDAIDKSTRPNDLPEPVLTPEKPAMADTTKIVILTEAQSALHAKLSADEQTAFLAKSSAERDALVAAALAADPIVYKTKGGVEIRKSHGDVALMLAKQGDATAEAMAVQAQLLAESQTAQANRVLAARAREEIGALGGTDEAKIAALRAIDSIADATQRAAVVEMLRGANAFALEAGKAKGGGAPPEPKADSPEAKIEALAVKIATEQKVPLATARALVFDTEEGAKLYRDLEIAKTAARANTLRPTA
jgi:hypothetical protein